MSQSAGTSSLDVVMNIKVQGGQKELGGIAKMIEQISSAAGKGGGGGGGGATGGIASSLDFASKGWGNFASGAMTAVNGIGMVITAANQLAEIMDRVAQFGGNIMGAGMGGLGLLNKLPSFVMDNMKELETSFLRLKALSKGNVEEARAAMLASNEMVKYTPYQTDQIMGLTAALKGGKVAIDAFKDSQGEAITLGKIQASGMAKVNEQALAFSKNMSVTPVSLMADLAASTGQVGEGMDAFVRGMSRALATGNITMLKDQLPIQVLKEVFGEGKSIEKDASKVIQNLYKYLLKENQVGMAAAASGTLAGIESNIAELPQMIAKAIGGDVSDPNSLYSKLRDGLGNAFAAINDVISDPAWQKGVKEALEPIVEVINKIRIAAGKAVAAVLKFVGEHPNLTKFGIIIFAIGSAFAIVTGATLVLIGTLGSLAITFGLVALAGTAMLGVFILMSLFIWPLYLAFFALAGVMSAVAAGIAAWGKWGDLMDRLEKGRILVTGLVEAFQNWNDTTTTVSQETADNLQKAGMLTWFMEAIKWVRHAQLVVRGFWDSFSAKISMAWEKAQPSLTRMGEAFGFMIEMVKTALQIFGLWPAAGDRVDEAASQIEGADIGNMIGDWIAAGISFVAWMARVASWFIHMGTVIIATCMDIGEWLWMTFVEPFLAAEQAINNMVTAFNQFKSGEFKAAFDTLNTKIQVANPFQSKDVGEMFAKAQAAETSLALSAEDLARPKYATQPGDTMTGGLRQYEPALNPWREESSPKQAPAPVKVQATLVNVLDGEVIGQKTIDMIKAKGELNFATPGGD